MESPGERRADFREGFEGQCVAGTEPVQKTERGERGSFWIFDAGAWDRVRKDNFNLQYDQLEARPAVKRDAPATSRA
mgnify:CR=1 FL=1